MNTLVVDLDDTLVDTQPLYSAAEASFFTFMDQIGFPRHEVEPVFRKINLTSWILMALAAATLATSWVKPT